MNPQFNIAEPVGLDGSCPHSENFTDESLLAGEHPEGIERRMPRGRIKGDHDLRRTQIAKAACKVFLRLGLARATLADIAREMGNTTGVLRHYFTDKDDLLLYVKNVLFDEMHEKAAASAEGHHGLEKLRLMVAELLPSDTASIDTFRLLAMFNGVAIGDSRLMRLQHKRNEDHVAELAQVITALQRDGIVLKELSPKVEAAGILALLDGLGEQQIMRPEPHSRELLMFLVNRHIDGLRDHKIGPRRRRDR